MDKFDQIRQQVKLVALKAQELWGVDVTQCSVTFNLRGRVAGEAGRKRSPVTGQMTLSLRFNRDMILGSHFDDILKWTVPHEVAHLCGYVNPALGNKHNAAWRNTCLALGGNGQTYHNYEVKHRSGTFVYVSSVGTEIRVSGIIHRRIKAGRRYRLRNGGHIDNNCTWYIPGQIKPQVTPQPVVAPNPVVVEPKPVVIDCTPANPIDEICHIIRLARISNGTIMQVAQIAHQQLKLDKQTAYQMVWDNWETA